MSDYAKPSFSRKPFGNKPFGNKSFNKPFGNKSFGNKGGFDRGSREMFKTDCAQCGNTCEVPFRPNGTKPVYCNNCFVRDTSGDRPARRDSAPRPSFHQAPQTPRNDQAFNDLKAELRVVNANLERLIAIMTPVAPATKASKGSKKKVK